MKHYRKIALLSAFILGFAGAYAQQLPDPGFEDWSGAAFDGNEQPRYWNYSNVSQLGIANFNFAEKVSGRTGYAMQVQDRSLTVMGIGETSPGYIALGQPWAYVASISAINQATAGTYGGISWTSRPDTMAVWIKRTGNDWDKENYNILFYSWCGTSVGASYKGKNGNCTTIPSSVSQYTIDEESDIRQATDHNECQTITLATQVAEGWIWEKAQYPNWTLIKVPIYYLNDQVPEKCNVIFSASNYPNYRANSGLYVGNTLVVDDVQLIYSSKIHKLYVGGKEWKGFDPNNTGVQTYSLGQGATQTPVVEAYRGNGSLTNPHSERANFPGRKLSGSEIQIVNGTVDGAPTTITVSAEDGSSTTTYQIQFVSQQSNNTKLADIQINGASISGFSAYRTSYSIALPYGTTSAPMVSATGQEDGQTISITQPTSANGTATITVTAQDGSTNTYTIQFSVAQLSDNTLADIQVNGTSIAGFSPTKSTYTIELPLGTTSAPTVTPVSAYPTGAQTITIVSNTLSGESGQCKITVSVPGNSVTKTYTLNYRVTASTYSYLSDLEIGGTTIDGFSADRLTYYVDMPMGTTTLPTITWTAGDPYQSISLDLTGINNLEGTAKVTVTAASGAVSIYRINFTITRSSVNTLSNIYINGVALEGFDPEQNVYIVELPAGSTTMPAITWEAGDEYQTVSLSSTGANGSINLLTVVAASGSTRVYRITFAAAAMNNATLNMIYLDGVALEGFNPNTLEYNVTLPQGTTTLPVVTYDQHDAFQTVTTRQPSGINGDYRLTVKPQTGASKTYTIHFQTTQSSNTSLQMIFLNGDSLIGFDPDTLLYIDTLAAGIATAPAITYTLGDPTQRVTMTQDGLTINLRVMAESGSSRTYVLRFIQQKSANAFLKMIYLNGDSLIGFDPENLLYTLTLDSATAPIVSVDKNEGQTVMIVQPVSYGTATISVTPEDGARNIYQIVFQAPAPSEPEQPETLSSDTLLQMISINGANLPDFAPGVFDYHITLGQSRALMPTIAVIKNDPTQSVAYGQSAENEIQIHVMAEDGHTGTYTIHYAPVLDSDATLSLLMLDGINLTGFAPDTYDYPIALPMGTTTLPQIIAIPNSNRTSMTISMLRHAYRIDTYAEDGTHLTYTLGFTIPASDDANLEAILLDGTPMTGFSSLVYDYTVTLPAGSTSLPQITAVAEDEPELIVVDTHNMNEASTIVVTAADGTTSQTYTITFTVAPSADTHLSNLELVGADLDFDPDTYAYTVALPYGSTDVPQVNVERNHQTQTVVIARNGFSAPTTVKVIAASGAEATYTINYTQTEPTAVNRLNGIVIADYGLLDLSTTNDMQFDVALPYGTQNILIDHIEKNYAEQEVVIEYGGTYRATKLTVYSGREDEAPVIYTLNPIVESHDPAQLLTLSIDGTPLAEFTPDRYNYIYTAGATKPQVTYTAAANAETDITMDNNKQVTIEVINGTLTHYYNVFFYYPGDLTFETNFENWTAYTNPNVGTDNTGEYPNGWHTPLFANVTGDASTYHPNKNVNSNNNATSGSRGATLQTYYLTTSAESMPGFVSLSDVDIAIGKWVLGIGAVSSSSTVTFGNGITFRNTPDRVSLDYNPQANNKINRWRFIYKANSSTGFTYQGDYNTKNQWQTITQDITYAPDFDPTVLDIIINSADSENPADYNVGISGAQARNQFTSTLWIDNLRFYYSSELNGLMVDGQAAIQQDNVFSYTLPNADYYGTPQLTYLTAVEDQAQQIAWSEDGVNSLTRSALIRNFAEDGTYTDYVLNLTRPQSTTDTIRTEVDANGDLHIWPGSPYQTIHTVQTAAEYTVTVIAEAGNQQIYHLPRHIAAEPTHTVDSLQATPLQYNIQPTHTEYPKTGGTPSQDSNLQSILINGLELSFFNSYVYDYTEYISGAVRLTTVRSQIGQTVDITRDNDTYTIRVEAEDGSQSIYTLNLIRDLSAHTSADLSQIIVGGTIVEGFSPNTYSYVIPIEVEYPATSAQLPDITYWTNDEMQTIQVEMHPTTQATYLHVTSGDGLSTADYELNFSIVQTNLPEPSHNALLSSIFTDGSLLSGFLPTTFTYSIPMEEGVRTLPDVTFTLGEEHQTVSTSQTANSISITVTAEDGTTTNTYVLNFLIVYSNDATLSMIYADGNPIPGYSPSQYTYHIDLPAGTAVLPALSYQKSYPDATVEESSTSTEHPLSSTTTFTVTAEDGITTQVYTVTLNVLISQADTLLMIYADDVPLPGYNPHIYDYTDTLEVGTRIFPVITYDAADALQTITTDTLTATDWTQAIAIHVTSEAGTQQTYTVSYTIAQSAVDTLQMIYIGSMPLANYVGQQNDYAIELPIGTQAMPEVDYIAGDPYQTVVISTTEWTTDLTVTAENGSVRIYHLSFTVALSDDSQLEAILLDGTLLPGYDKEVYSYNVVLPYGTTNLPVITYTLGEEHQTAVITTTDMANDAATATIVVTAENGSTSTYTIAFTIARSTNALLDMIYVNGDTIQGYMKDEFAYTYEIPSGSDPAAQVVTYVPGDDQQTISLSYANGINTITVVAGDGLTTEEYTVTIVVLPSTNSYLADLQIDGVTIDGFDRDTLTYTITYPIGTSADALATISDITAIPEDPAATVSIEAQEDGNLTILVTAEDGSVRVYVIIQTILLSDNCLLDMIYLDGAELVGFDPLTFTYTYLLPQGAPTPEIVAVPQDTLATVEMSAVSVGEVISIYCIAEDGTEQEYQLTLAYSDINSGLDPDIDDVRFIHISGTHDYLAVTIRKNVSLIIFSSEGRLMLEETVPVCDPNYIRTATDASGNEYISEVLPGANGVIFTVYDLNRIHYYVFRQGDTPLSKSGKFMLRE